MAPNVNQLGDPLAFSYDGGPMGCLLLHGFTGTPAEMRLVGQHMAQQGWTVSAPLLPGHGTEVNDLNQVRWQDWYQCAEEQLLRLEQSCQTVFVGALSMGTLLALRLAAFHPEVAGLLLYAPAIRVKNPLLCLAPLARYFAATAPSGPEGETDLFDPEAPSRLWHYDAWPLGGAAQFYRLQRVVRQDLGRVSAPTIIFHSSADGTVHAQAPLMILNGISSDRRSLVLLHHSGHCMTVDGERERIFSLGDAFVADIIDDARAAVR